MHIVVASPSGKAHGMRAENETCACRIAPACSSSSHSHTLWGSGVFLFGKKRLNKGGFRGAKTMTLEFVISENFEHQYFA